YSAPPKSAPSYTHVEADSAPALLFPTRRFARYTSPPPDRRSASPPRDCASRTNTLAGARAASPSATEAPAPARKHQAPTLLHPPPQTPAAAPALAQCQRAAAGRR